MNTLRKCPTFVVGKPVNDGRKLPVPVNWAEYRIGRTGRPERKSKWFATAREAQAWATDMQARVQAAFNNPDAFVETPARPRRADSLAALAGNHADIEQFTGFMKHVKAHTAPNTWHGYRSNLKNYLAPERGHARFPGLGDHLVQAITRPVVIEYLDELYNDGVPYATRIAVLATLSRLITYARDHGKYRGDHPCFNVARTSVRKVTEKKTKRRPNPFTRDETARFFDTLEANEHLCWFVYFWVFYMTGIRPGEAAALRWVAEDGRALVDFDARTIEIEAAIDEHGTDKDTKTHEPRIVEIDDDDTIELLRRWQKWQRAEALRRGTPKAAAFVMTTDRLARILPNQSSMRDVFARTLTSARITTTHTPYNWRHTFASFHLSTDWDRLGWVAAQMGDNPETVKEFYFQYRPKTEARRFVHEHAHAGRQPRKGWGK